MSRKIKAVMCGIGEPIKGIGAVASTLYDGRVLIYEDNTKELVISNNYTLQKVYDCFRPDELKVSSKDNG